MTYGRTATVSYAIKPHEHSYTQAVTKEPACTEEGLRTYTCSCGDTYTETIPANGHAYVNEVCSGCGAFYPTPHKHSYMEAVTKEPACTEEGVRTYTCSCGDTYTEAIPANGHRNKEIRNARKADCTQTGYTGDTYCKDCNTQLAKGREAAKTEHTYVNGVCSGCGDVKMKPKEPFIKGEDGKNGWDNILDNISEQLKQWEQKPDAHKESKKVTVDMNGSTAVLGDIFEKIKGEDITVEFNMGDGISWRVNGRDVTGVDAESIDLGVKKNASSIPIDIINNVTGERYSIQIQLSHEGEFGFTATLTVQLDAKNKDLYANLFYYNKDSKELEFMTYDRIDEKGNADLAFTHASDYVIVIDKVPLDGSEQDSQNPAEDKNVQTKRENPPESPKTEDIQQAPSLVWLFVIGAVVLLLVIGAAVVIRQKTEREKE